MQAELARRRLIGRAVALVGASASPGTILRARGARAAAAQAFFGLGIQLPEPSLGLILQEARGYIRSDVWFGVCPGLTIVVMVLALNQADDDMAERADPRSAVHRMRQSGL